jgi:Domain of unknown function (DUF6134)
MQRFSLLAAIGALTLFPLSPLQAGAVGAGVHITRPHLEYTVLRDHEMVGTHVIDFSRYGDTMNVKIATNVVVKIAFIPVYRFQHSGIETWQGNRLIALKTRTNDDGTPHQLAAAAEGDHLRVAGDGAKRSVAGAILPASLWNEAIVNQSALLNTLNGTEMRVSVIDRGSDIVNSGGVDVSAHHYTISGGLDRDVWFDNDNTLVRVAFAAKDGSHIVYQLR